MESLRLALCLALIAALACGDDDAGPADAATPDDASSADAGPEGIVAERPECENLQPIHCLLPSPSSHFLAEDPETETGFRVDLQPDMLPVNQNDVGASTARVWNHFDGFSPMTSLMAGFWGKVDKAPLADELHIADSLLESSPTVLLDAETGERVAHWAEPDEWVNGDPRTTTLYIRPAARLKENHRYVVAIRGLTRLDGSVVEPSEYFRALRDGETSDVPSLEARRPAMEQVFTDLAAAGVARDELLLAWEFHTASGESLRRDMLAIREDGLRRFEEGMDGAGACTVTDVDENPREDIFRRVRGTFTVPLYMTTAFEGAVANRDADGDVAYNGTAEAEFEVIIPNSVVERVREGGGAAPGMMYGHGLLGSSGQVSSGGPREVAVRAGMVVFGTTYWGLGGDSANILTNVVPTFENFDQVGERLMQGTLNSLLLPKAFRGACRELDAMRVDVEGELQDTLSAEEPLYYYGISQGGIMGATIAALSEDIDAYVLQVGAIGYSHMVRRSRDFGPFEAVMDLWYPNKLDRDWLVLSSQSMWDLAEPATFAPWVIEERLEGVGGEPPRVLYQTSRYDIEVNNANSDIAARTIGLPALRSSVYEPWGVELVDGDVPNAYVVYHLDDVEPQEIGTREPRGDNSAHGDLRFMEPVIEQIVTFLQPEGVVEDTCPDGSCLIDNPRAD